MRKKKGSGALMVSPKHCEASRPECERLLKEVVVLAEEAIHQKGQQVCPYCGHPGTHSRECVLSEARIYLARMKGRRGREKAPSVILRILPYRESVASWEEFYSLFRKSYSCDGARCLYSYLLSISHEDGAPYCIDPDIFPRNYCEYDTLEACLEANEVHTLKEVEEQVNVVRVLDKDGNHTGRYIVGC